jgi:hypothetical protein
MTNPRTRTVDDLEVASLIRLTSVTAEKLEILAGRLRKSAEHFKKRDLRGGATGVAADIVNDYVQGVGSQGTFLWSIVRDAAVMDTRRASEKDGAE